MEFFKQWARYFFGWLGGVSAAVVVVGPPLWYMTTHAATPLGVIGVIVWFVALLTGLCVFLEYKGWY